jgi:tetratricopeptide (TPR) repeat protein
MMIADQLIFADLLFSASAQRASGLESLAGAALQRGIDRFMSKDYAGAAAEFKRSMGLGRNAPFAADAGHYLALAYLQMDDLPQAEAAYQSALEIDRQRDDLRVKLGNLYHSQKRYAEAMREYAEAVRLNPSAVNRYALGQAYIELGRFADAESQYAEIQRLAPREAGGFLGMGQTFSRQGRHAEAIAQFEQAIARDPRLYAAYSEIGYSRADLGDMAGAQQMVDFLEEEGQPGLADTLSRYMYKVDPPKMVFAHSASSFMFSMGRGTPVAALDAYLVNAGAAKTFNIQIQFDKRMDRESIENPANWTIARSAGAGPGQSYNFGMRIPETEVRIQPTPEAVTWDEKNQTATVFFTIRQNASITGTIDPSHIEFSFRGKDVYGLSMSPKADQFCGFIGVA